MSLKIVIAPDSFKESLSATEVCESIASGILSVFPQAEIRQVPVADGGEGTVDAFLSSAGGEKIFVSTTDPLGRGMQGFYGLLPDSTIVIEVAAASGLHLLDREERDPLKTSSFGTGLIIRKALEDGIRQFIITLGGSATNDGGTGIFQALGGKVLDTEGEVIMETGPYGLRNMADIDPSGICPEFFRSTFTVACDVDNPLLGKNGATSVYGPQKGADADSLKILERFLENWVSVLEKKTGKSIRDIKGSGAAGGMVLPFLALTDCTLKRGFDMVKEVSGLEEEIKTAGLVISGEGKIDQQTLRGKTVKGVMDLCLKYGKKLVLFAGKAELDPEREGYPGIKVFSISEIEPDKEKAMRNARELLMRLAEKSVGSRQ